MTPEKLAEIDAQGRELRIKFSVCASCGELHSVQGVIDGWDYCPRCLEEINAETG